MKSSSIKLEINAQRSTLPRYSSADVKLKRLILFFVNVTLTVNRRRVRPVMSRFFALMVGLLSHHDSLPRPDMVDDPGNGAVL